MVTVSVRPVEAPTSVGSAAAPAIPAAVESPVPAWLVEVADQGPGFPAGFRERAFDVSTRADEARSRDHGGAGLGLAIARGIVAAHGGTMWIEPGPGGRVCFAVPAVPAVGPVENVGGGGVSR